MVQREVPVGLLAQLGAQPEEREMCVVLKAGRLSAGARRWVGKKNGRRNNLQWKMGDVKQVAFEHDAVVQLGYLQWWDHVSDCALFHSVWLD
jgi:hypothetical protein